MTYLDRYFAGLLRLRRAARARGDIAALAILAGRIEAARAAR